MVNAAGRSLRVCTAEDLILMKIISERERDLSDARAIVAAQGQRLWSIVVHFEYQDGFELDYVLENGLATSDVGAALAACGHSHWTGSVVRYHCYPVPE